MQWVYELVWLGPLENLYWNGPVFLNNYGFWGGESPENICHDLTTVRSGHWIENDDICQELLNRRFQSFIVGINTFIYFYIIYRIINRLF